MKISFTVFLLVLLIAGCNDPATREAQSGAEVDTQATQPAENTQNATERWVTYAGTLPCADCRGIQTEISLQMDAENENPAFKITETYVGTKEGNKTFQSAGTYTTSRGTATDRNALIYQLDPDEPGESRSFIRISDSQIRSLDRKRVEIQSKLNYTLTRK